MVEYLLTIPEVKTRTSMNDFSSSKDIKKMLESQKITKMKSLPKQRRESISLWTTKKLIRRWLNVLSKKLKYKGDWAHEVQDTMMLVATVIATVAFQGGVNPPGGIWQDDTLFNVSDIMKNKSNPFHEWFDSLGIYAAVIELDYNSNVVFPAGTGVMGYQPQLYWKYLSANTISFLASLSVILMIVGRFPLKNRICSWILTLVMCTAVVSLAIGYWMGIQMVNLISITDYIELNKYNNVLFATVLCWLGVIGMLGLWQVSHFLKSFFHIFTPKLKPHTASKLNS